jgi:hypothetical protein
MPNMTEIDFTGRYKDKLMSQLPRANMPHMKRIMNNQVFLEESEPFVYDDFSRRNNHAIDAANHILNAGQPFSPAQMSSSNYFAEGMSRGGGLPSLGP